MPKQSRLGENAEIYQPRAFQSEREKLHEMTMKKKLAYLWEYYRVHALITVLGLGLIIYIIYTIVTPKADIRLNVVFIGNTIDEQVLEDYRTQLFDYLHLDAKKNQDIEFNTSFYEMGSAREPLFAFIAAREVDVMILPESDFKDYAYGGFLDKMSDQLPTDLYSLMTNRFYISDRKDDPEKDAYGIYMTDTDLYKNHSALKGPYVLGILSNSRHKDNAVEFVRYLFKQNP